MADVFVTGTDTAVGKTVIAAALVKALRERGVRALGFKPAETGLDGAGVADSDLLQGASGDVTALATPLLRLAEPLAPAVAAERAGTAMRGEEIESRIAQLRREGYTLVVEGAGGALAPLAWQSVEKGVRPLFPSAYYTIVDLAERCGLEAIVVARAGLGTLNHVALTVALLRSRRIPIQAVVLNGGQPWPPADLAEATNPEALARMVPDAPIIYVPHHERADAIEATVPYLRSLYP